MKARAFLLFIASLLLPGPAWGKNVSIEWKDVDRASRYQLQITQGGKVLVESTLEKNQTSWKGNLKSGFYEYRIRAIDKVQQGGQWSSALQLGVPPDPPAPELPVSGEMRAFFTRDTSVKLRWKGVEGVTRYRV